MRMSIIAITIFFDSPGAYWLQEDFTLGLNRGGAYSRVGSKLRIYGNEVFRSFWMLYGGEVCGSKFPNIELLIWMKSNCLVQYAMVARGYMS